jgi:hypothetical protein
MLEMVDEAIEDVVPIAVVVVVTDEVPPRTVLVVTDEVTDTDRDVVVVVAIGVAVVELLMERVAHALYETCVADETITWYQPAPLSCCCIGEFTFDGWSTGV